MKTICTIIIYFISYHFLYSQGEIIDRKTHCGKDFNLKILEVQKDTLTYRYFGKTIKTPLSTILAYRVNHNTDDFIFINPKDKETYSIINNCAVRKDKIPYQPYSQPIERIENLNIDDYKSKLLKEYELVNDSFDIKSLSHNIFLYKNGSSEFINANPKSKLFIVLKNDSLGFELSGKLFKIMNDSIMYFSIKTKKVVHYFAINKNDVKYVVLESDKAFVRRMVLGGCLMGVANIFVPFIVLPIYIFNHPNFEKYDIENQWKLILCEKNNCN